MLTDYFAQFCGRVLMFLASVYPLSEKSAVNLTGKVSLSTFLDSVYLIIFHPFATCTGERGKRDPF